MTPNYFATLLACTIDHHCYTLIWEKGCSEWDLVGLTAAVAMVTVGVKTDTVAVSTRALSAPYGSHSDKDNLCRDSKNFINLPLF